MNRLILLVESRIRGNVYVRFGGEHPKTHRSNTAGRWMLSLHIMELQNNPNYSLDNSNSVYVIFMLIGIIGYFTVPTVAGWTTTATSTVPRPRPEDLQPVPQVPDWEISEGVCVENKQNRNIKIMKTDGIQITD